MSDILIHAAIVENQEQLKKWVEYTVDPTGITDSDWFKVNNRAGWPIKNQTWTTFENSTCPSMVKQWKKYLSPLVKTHTNGFKVCDTSGYFRCGASCNWTVPAGVTSVQFQLWGPGGGSSGQCCCGGTLFGPSGSYMLSTVPVTPGETYCLCSGCAYCCYADQTTPGLCSGPTYITSTTGYSVCAEGGYPCMPSWNSDVGGSAQNTCMIPTQDGCAAQSCSGWNFCWDSSDDNTYVPHAFASQTWYAINPQNSVNYGIPAIWASFCLGNQVYCNSCMISAPVFGFENCTCKQIPREAMCTGTGGCHYQANAGYQQIPAAGGYGGYVCGGYTSGCGDPGGMGMICVSYNCG